MKSISKNISSQRDAKASGRLNSSKQTLKSITNEKIKELYQDPNYGLMGLQSFTNKLKKDGYDVSLSKLKLVLGNEEVLQMTKKPISRGFYKITSSPKNYQIDTMFLNYSATTYPVLVMIDILSRKAFVFPLTNNTIQEKITALRKFLENMRILGLIGDAEFKKKTFTDFLDKNKIRYSFEVAENEHISQGNRLGIIDRFIRTLRTKIVKYMVQHKTLRFMPILDELVNSYNQTPHSSLYGKTPNEVYDSLTFLNAIMTLNNLHNTKIRERQDGIKPKDYVRVALVKQGFQKEGLSFSKDFYKVKERKGNRFIVETVKGEELEKIYKYNELQKVVPSVIQNVPNINFAAEVNVPIALESEKKFKNVEKQLKKQGIDLSNIIY
jgi:hypothetical protein